jgi:3-hydroxybutyryl-CoA dehydrogenase
MFFQLEDICPGETIIASNTSTLLPTPLSEKMKHKERLLVAHFWNPAHLAPLVEVCGSPATDPEVIETTLAILRKIGNEPVLMRKEILGFIGNRIMHAMNREALALISAGVCEAEDIDRVVNTSFGPRFAHLGPMEYLDFSGLDLIRNIQGYLYGDLDNTPGVLPAIDKLVSEGKLGLKTGKGLFDWSQKENNIREKRDKEFIRRLKEPH